MRVKMKPLYVAVMLAIASAPGISHADAFVQCPGDHNGDAIIDPALGEGDPAHPNAKCMHLTGGDGFVTMADGHLQYSFGFGQWTGKPDTEVMRGGILNATLPGPRIELKEDDEFYLTLSNVGLVKRPDLFDPHTVHYHGAKNISSYFDGVPENTVSTNQGGSLTYYYNIKEPGTYMYHCHVEATEHMQMGMQGNFYVHPKQDGNPFSFVNANGDAKTFTKFVYNDGDGTTGFDVEFPLQLTSFDPVFHDDHIAVQPLPFATMFDSYTMINGRGYPDTALDPAANPPEIMPVPVDADGVIANGNIFANGNQGVESQPVSSLVKATKGDRILLRLTNLSVYGTYTVTAPGLNMKVVGKGSAQLRGPAGNLYLDTNTVTLGGGEGKDIMIDTSDPGIKTGTYFLYTTNLKYLSNNTEDFGGMMTEIVIN